MIKYLGSKRTLVPVLGAMARSTNAQTVVDLFTGTTRVAQEFKRSGLDVTCNDIATYSEVFGQSYISTDSRNIDKAELGEALTHLENLPGKPGYFTRMFCEEARYFQPKNGARVDVIRDEIEAVFRESPLYPILLTSLILAADRVDSTAGLQMAYLKSWAPRSHNDLEMRVPDLLPGGGQTMRADAQQLIGDLPRCDLMYLDPPYNQHRYFTNYHIWETLVRWDRPESYGVARKRVDARAEEHKSVFNKKREMPPAFQNVLQRVNAEVVFVSYNNESWISAEEMVSTLEAAGYPKVEAVSFGFRRYVGAKIGIFNPQGERVGKVSHVRNKEYIFVAGPTEKVDAAIVAAADFGSQTV